MINKFRLIFSSTVLLMFLGHSLSSGAQPTQEQMDKVPVLKEAYQAEKKANYKAALRLYRHAYANDMGKFAALAGIVRILNITEQGREADELLKDEVKSNPFDLELRLLLADQYVGRGNYAGALDEYSVAEKINPNDYRAALKRGLMNQKIGKFDLAIKDLSVYIEKSGAPGASAFLRRAQCHQAVGDYVAAEKDVRKSHQMEPFVSETLSTFVKILAAQKKYTEAEPIAKQCSEVDPQGVLCWDLRGDVAWELKNPAAVAHYDRAVALVPNDYEIRKKLADALDAHGKFQEADAQYAQVLKLRPNYEAALRNHVASLMKRRAYGPAAAVLAAFHKNEPKNLWVGIEYSNLMSLVGRHDTAMSIMKETRRASRSEIADMYYGYALFQAGRFGDAEDAIEDIKDPKFAKDYNLGITLLRRKKWDKAVKHFEKVAADSKNFLRAQVNKAIALQEDGKVDSAIESLSANTFMADMKEGVAKQIQFLTESKSRSPSSVHESDGPLKAFTEWELPQL